MLYSKLYRKFDVQKIRKIHSLSNGKWLDGDGEYVGRGAVQWAPSTPWIAKIVFRGIHIISQSRSVLVCTAYQPVSQSASQSRSWRRAAAFRIYTHVDCRWIVVWKHILPFARNTKTYLWWNARLLASYIAHYIYERTASDYLAYNGGDMDSGWCRRWWCLWYNGIDAIHRSRGEKNRHSPSHSYQWNFYIATILFFFKFLFVCRDWQFSLRQSGHLFSVWMECKLKKKNIEIKVLIRLNSLACRSMHFYIGNSHSIYLIYTIV